LKHDYIFSAFGRLREDSLFSFFYKQAPKKEIGYFKNEGTKKAPAEAEAFLILSFCILVI